MVTIHFKKKQLGHSTKHLILHPIEKKKIIIIQVGKQHKGE